MRMIIPATWNQRKRGAHLSRKDRKRNPNTKVARREKTRQLDY